MNQITQAFVLGAGLGKRLRPLTDDLPKPLVPIFQKPLITFALDHLIDIGVSRFVINTHKLPESFQNFFGKNGYRGCSTTLVHEPDLLETGGGIKNAESYLGVEPFITYSGDILADIPLQPLIDEHFHRGNDVTLALRETGLAAAVAFRDHRVVDISNRYGVPGNYDFANIAVWNREIFRQIPPHRKISFVPIEPRMGKTCSPNPATSPVSENSSGSNSTVSFRNSAPTLIAELSSDHGLPIPQRLRSMVAFALPTCSLNDPRMKGGMVR